MLEVSLAGEQMQLLPERALWWEKERTLVVSDLHWGKSGHFRKHGIAIPSETQQQDEIKLANLIRIHKAQRLVIAGDMFHSKTNRQVESFLHFREAHGSLQIDLVTGNHDILAEGQYARWQLRQHKECLVLGPFCFAHDHRPADEFVIHGHIHPALRISSRGAHQPAIKLCCFAQDGKRMILPAFGQFTGTHLLEPGEFLHIYLIAEEKVIQWK